MKTLSQAEQVMRKEHRDGSFFVYRTASEHVPYSLVYRLVAAELCCAVLCCALCGKGVKQTCFSLSKFLINYE